MMNTTETLPLAVDHALLWRALEPAPSSPEAAPLSLTG